MKNILRLFMMMVIVAFLIVGVSKAADLEKVADKFYAGLADIIERNMNSPDACVKEVDDYYRANQGTVRQIREAAKKAMEQAAPMMEKMMDKYMSMTEEELEALEKQQSRQGAGMQQKMQQNMSPGAKRYSDALEAFTVKHPMHGMKVATKAMQLVPMSSGQGYQMGQ